VLLCWLWGLHLCPSVTCTPSSSFFVMHCGAANRHGLRSDEKNYYHEW